jgi:hypothetical protein
MDITDKISRMVEGFGEVTHPGVLEVPDGKDVQSLPLAHFVGLAKTKGEGAVSKALMNLYRWNKTKNPGLSSWAKSMQEKLAATKSD